jgi:predicted signal transduction protein with EAL and GGDEF domain
MESGCACGLGRGRWGRAWYENDGIWAGSTNRVYLDDFGSGHSSLLHLKELPVDVIKIDQSLFENFPSNEKDVFIILAIITLSNSLGITAVAEGVEAAEQLQAMYNMRCDWVQGYVFSEALSCDRATLLLSDSIEFRRMVRPLARILQKKSNGPVVTSNGFVNDIRDTDRILLSSPRAAHD